MLENDMITDESQKYVMACVENPDNWQETVVYAGADERPLPGYVFAQEISCKRFLELASGMASNFDECIRRFGLPTEMSVMYK